MNAEASLIEAEPIFDLNMEDLSSVWLVILEKVKRELGEDICKTWFSKLRIADFNGVSLTLLAPTRFIRNYIMTSYSDSFIAILEDFFGKIKFSIAVEERQEQDLKHQTQEKQQLSSEGQITEEDIFALSLDERYTFENFVVGKPNEFAYAAARSVAESLKVLPESNPLFLYGGVGLGKTHLMNAIAWYIKSNNPERKVLYLSAEKFMYEFVKALKNKDILCFKEMLRSVDVLMIDDVQFICNKDSTQEEFFHTFNTLIDNNRQIVISADRSPSDLDGMEERIKSRLGWGLVADIHSTTYELRLGILLSKIEQMSINVPKIVVEFLASKITSNVRELEGALNKVVAHATLMKCEITMETTQEILRDLIRSSDRAVSMDEIVKKVAEYYKIKISDILSDKKTRNIARPRQIAMYLCKHLTPVSLVRIGQKFAGKDHTTVIHAVKTVEKLVGSDIDFAEDIRILSKILQS